MLKGFGVENHPQSEKRSFPDRQHVDKDYREWQKDLSPTDLVAIHVTNTFPDENKLRSHVGWAEEKNALPRFARETVHFTLNMPVVAEHGIMAPGSSWHERKFVVLAPFHKFDQSQVSNIKSDDTFIFGDFVIPPGSTILVDSQALPELRDNGIITNDEMQNYLRELGTDDQYVATEHSPLAEVAIARDGINYIICDLAGKNFRARISGAVKQMGYRPAVVELDRDFLNKYGYPAETTLGVSHDRHPDQWSEQLSIEINNVIGNGARRAVLEAIADEEFGFLEAEHLVNLIESILRQYAELGEKFSRAKKILVKKIEFMLNYISLFVEGNMDKLNMPAKNKEALGALASFVKKKSAEMKFESAVDQEQLLDHLTAILNFNFRTIGQFVGNFDGNVNQSGRETAERVLENLIQITENDTEAIKNMLDSPRVNEEVRRKIEGLASILIMDLKRVTAKVDIPEIYKEQLAKMQ